MWTGLGAVVGRLGRWSCYCGLPVLGERAGSPARAAKAALARERLLLDGVPEEMLVHSGSSHASRPADEGERKEGILLVEST